MGDFVFYGIIALVLFLLVCMTYRVFSWLRKKSTSDDKGVLLGIFA